MEQLAIDVRTPGVLRHGGQFVFQEIVDTPTYMLIALEDPRKPKPTRVVVDGVSKQYRNLTEEERALPLYQVFALDCDLQVGSYYMLDRDVAACVRWHNIEETCDWIHPGYLPRVLIKEDDVRFIHGEDMGSSYTVSKRKFLACWKRGYKSFAELDNRAETLKPKFDETLWRMASHSHNAGESTIVKGTRLVKALQKGEVISSHSNAELTDGWLSRLGVKNVVLEEQYFKNLDCYQALGLDYTESLLSKDGVELSKEEVLALLSVEGSSIMLPTDVQFSSTTYGILKEMLQKAQGKYTKGGFKFDSESEAQAVLNTLLEGKEIDVKKSLQYYATTEAAADIALKGVDLTGKTVFEPHGGEGFLVKKAFDLGAKKVLTSEIYHKFHPALQATGAEIISEDVFAVTPEMLEDVDVVIMNPPFNGGADIKHFNFLLSIIPRGIPIYGILSGCVKHHKWKLYSEFRAYLASKGVEPIDIPAGAFKESGTNVSTVAVQIPES